MIEATDHRAHRELRKQYVRPLWIGIALSVTGELLIFLVFGVMLFPAGNILNKFLWTVVFCGVGMGASLGALIDLLVVGRWQGLPAIAATASLSVFLLGMACNLLCLNLDQHFYYFGGTDHLVLFLANGIVMAALGGVVAGMLLFTEQGRGFLDRLGL